MKRKPIVIMVMMAMLAFLSNAAPQEVEERQKRPPTPKIILEIVKPAFPAIEPGTKTGTETDQGEEMTGKSLAKQLDCFLKAAVVLERKNQKYLFTPFSDKLKKRITRWLIEASEIETDECHKNYLKELSKNILEKSRFSVDLPRWVSLKESRAEIVFPRAERYLGELLVLDTFFNFSPKTINEEENVFFDTFVYLNDPVETRNFEQYTGVFSEMQDYLYAVSKEFIRRREISYSTVLPSFKVSQLVFSSQPAVRGFTLVYPELRDEEDEFKIIVFKNLVTAYFEGVIKPISIQVLTEARLWDVDDEAYFSNLIMRRISHHLGPVFAIKAKGEDEEQMAGQTKRGQGQKARGGKKQKKKKQKQRKKEDIERELKTISEVLGNLFPVIEAVKSQTFALHSTPVLIKNGLLPEDRAVNIYTTYLVSLIDQLRHQPRQRQRAAARAVRQNWEELLGDPNGENYLAALIQLNFLLQKEGVLFNLNSRMLDLNPFKFEEVVKEFTHEILRLLQFPSPGSAKGFIQRYSDLPPQLEEILKNIEDIPLKVEFQLNTLEDKESMDNE